MTIAKLRSMTDQQFHKFKDILGIKDFLTDIVECKTDLNTLNNMETISVRLACAIALQKIRESELSEVEDELDTAGSDT